MTIGLGTLLALALAGTSIWLALLVGAALAPTDAALGAGMMANQVVPARIRRLLDVESGLNDGIATPFVSVAIAGAAIGGEVAEHGPAAAVAELALGVLIGAAVGGVGGLLVSAARKRGWAAEGFAGSAVLGLTICAYASAVALSGNGFIAAFVGGLAFGTTGGRRGEPLIPFVEETGALVSLLVWLAFGAVEVVPAMKALTWQMVLYAVLSLTVIRMVPVAVALAGARLGRATVALVGWFGPRGLASVVFALLALEDLGEPWPAVPSRSSPSPCCSASSPTVSRPSRWPPGTRNRSRILPTGAVAPRCATSPIAGSSAGLATVAEPHQFTPWRMRYRRGCGISIDNVSDASTGEGQAMALKISKSGREPAADTAGALTRRLADELAHQDGQVRQQAARRLRELGAVDRAVYAAVAATPTPSLDEPLRLLSNAANNSRLWLGIATGLRIVGGKSGRRAATRGTVAIGVTSALVNLAVKGALPRQRPDRVGAQVPGRRNVRMPGSTSFPSGHAAAGFAFAAAVGRDLPWLGVVLRFMAAAVAYSRVHPECITRATPWSAR